jgi:hypothetical protein
MVSLPIRDKQSPIRYADIKIDGESIAPLVSRVTHGRILPDYGAHLDPDLSVGSLPRLNGWRPIFGQTGSAQGHLNNNRVQPGDMFLFFGLFRQTTFENGELTWVKGSKLVHVIWGWLQIAEILPVDISKERLYDWAQYHPHCCWEADKNNVLYIASRHLSFGQIVLKDVPSAGIFPKFSESRQLTAPLAPNTSLWRLPEWFFPRNGRRPLTYHSNMERWRMTAEGAELKAVAKGQEFILDCDEYPEALSWLSYVLRLGN